MNTKNISRFRTVAVLQMSVIIIFFLCSCDRYERLDLSTPETKQYPTEITLDEAEKMLLEMMSGFDSSPTKSGGSLSRKISGGYSVGEPINVTKDGEVSPYFHIFNFEDESGFAIMSGDTRVTPLLAYALEGNINQGDTIDNPGLALYMSRLSSYFNDVITIDTISGRIDRDSIIFMGAWEWEFSEMINGPCPVKWGQWYPYNYYCPQYGERHMAPTCCVATAVAQLMACYRYPENYKGHGFDWDLMISESNAMDNPGTGEGVSPVIPIYPDIEIIPPDSLPLPVPSEGLLQVARLMEQLGLPENLGVYYTDSSSSAYTPFVPKTLINFDFLDGGIFTDLSDFEDDKEMFKMNLINELKKGYYCIIRANETRANGSGHCWLLHGLLTMTNIADHPGKKEYYMLCNFGWDGNSDGYYLMDVFNTTKGPVIPYSDGIGNYSEGIKYIIGIRV